MFFFVVLLRMFFIFSSHSTLYKCINCSLSNIYINLVIYNARCFQYTIIICTYFSLEIIIMYQKHYELLYEILNILIW